MPYCARLVSELFGPRAEIHVCTHWCRASPFRRFRTIGGVPEASCGICTRLERHHCTVQAWCCSKNRAYGFDAILAQGGFGGCATTHAIVAESALRYRPRQGRCTPHLGAADAPRGASPGAGKVQWRIGPCGRKLARFLVFGRTWRRNGRLKCLT